jgi:hypothetical protein
MTAKLRSTDRAAPAPSQPTPPAAAAPAPFKPRKKLFVILSIAMAAWIVALVVMYVKTVAPVAHEEPDGSTPTSAPT